MITYRQATLNDINILINSRVEFMKDYWGEQDEQTISTLEKELEMFFKETIPNQAYISVLAFDGETWVGVGGMSIQCRPGSFRLPNGKSGYIMNMYTIPAYRRRGIALSVLDKLVEIGRQSGIKLFDLNATEEGEPVYIKYGFIKHKEPNYRLFSN